MANVVNQRDALLQASSARIVDVELKPNILQAVRGVSLSASGNIFKASAGGVYTPSEITVKATLLAFSGQPTLTWTVIPEGSATLTGSEYGVRTLKFLDMTQNSCVVRVEVSDGATTYSGQVTITKVWEGPLDKDFTPPPTPLGFSTSSALTSVFIRHDEPYYQQGHGHLRTRVYGKIVKSGDPLPTFSDAVEIAQFTGNIYAHSSNPSTTWRLWIKWETVDGVLSTNPAGGVNGLEAVTGQDVELLLDTLSGQVTESQLSATLGARINLIDGNAPGSVNERIKSQVSGIVDALEAESSARVLAGILIEDQVELLQTTLASDLTAVRDVLEREVADRVAADLANTNAIDLAAASLESSLAAEVSARELAGSTLAAAQETTGLQLGALAADVAQEVESRTTGDTALATAASTLTASQAGTAAALRVEQETRATLDESLSTQTTTLAAVAGANSAALIVEQQSRSDADSAVSSQVTDLAAAVGTNAAALKVEQEVRSGADGALSGQTLTIAAETAGNSAALAVEQQARADANSAQALQITSLAAEAGINAGLIQVEQQVRADAVSAAATQIATVSAATDTTAAALKLEQQARADADGSQAGQLSVIAAATDLNLAAIKSEQDVRTDGDSATASQVTTIGSAVGSALSGVISEQAARADADSASASVLNGLVADVGSALAGIKTEQSVRAASDEAAATQATVIAATLGANTSAITQEQAARSADTGALASQVTTLGVSLDGKASVGAVSSLQTQVETIDGVVVAQGQQLSQLVAEQKAGTATLRAALEVEELVRTSETEALTKQTTKLEASFASNAAAIKQEAQARADADEAEANLRLALAAAVAAGDNTNAASLVVEQSARATADSAQAAASSTLSTAVGANAATLATQAQTSSDADSAQASQVSALTASTSVSSAALVAEQDVRATQNSAQALALSGMAVANGANSAGLLSEQQVRSDATSAVAQRLDSLTAIAGSSAAAITSEATARADGQSATAQQIGTLSTSVGANTAAIQTEATTRATQTGDLFAQYTVKIDTAGRVSGFGLASTAAASGTNSSEFAIRADRFYIAPPADFTQETAPAGTSGKVWYKPSTKETFRYDGAAWVTFSPIAPFTVQATPTTINGVAVPAGVYMDAAFIKDGTITNAKVGSLSADKLTAGTIAAARIGAGSITATHIDSRGLSIKDAAGNVILAAGTPLQAQYVTPDAGWLNSNLAPSINAAATTATWSGISGAGKPADGATAGSNLIKKATFTDGSMGGWGGSAVCAGCHGGASEIQTNRRDTLENGNQFVVTPGETLYAAGDIWTGGSAYGAAVGAAFLGADGNYIHWQGASKGPSQDWSRVSTPILVPAGAVTAIPWLQIDGPGGQDLPYVSFSRLYLGRQQEGATVGMSEIESSTGLTSVNGWSLNKNGSFKAVGSGNSIQVSPNAASISFTKPDGNAAFFVNESGSALFGGSLTAATGTFAGTLAAGVLDSASFDSIKYVYPNSGNYGVTVPAKKAGWASLSLKVTMVGAGGGGGGGAASGAPNRDPTSSGGGGGAGQKSVYTFNNLSSGAVIPITVGAGGAGGGANTTWNGSSVSGGSGGSGGSSGITVGSNSYYASGGTGGGAGTSALADDFGYYGNGTGGGAGGSLGGSPGSGGFRISAAGGAGGSSEFGNGGGGGSASYRSASAGGAGSIGAGGGGGGADASDAGTGYAGNGGAGGSGYILLEFYDPNTVVLNGRYSALISWLDSIGHGAVPSNAR